jgi:hypothetical protein
MHRATARRKCSNMKRPPMPGFRFTRLLVAASLLSACGARSSLPTAYDVPSSTGGQAGTTGGTGGTGPSDGGTGGLVEPSCLLEDLSTWDTERYRDEGDYERAAVAVSGVPWVALKVRNGNIALVELGLDDAAGIVFLQRIDIPDSPIYPVALDVDERRFVLLTTTGINWNGDVELWRIDRQDGTVLHVPVGNPPADPAYTIYSAIGLAGDDVAVAYARAAENQGTIELRNDQLEILQSLPVSEVSFTAVHTSFAAVDIYAGADARWRVEAGTFGQQPVDPDWQVFGGLGSFLVEIGNQIRLRNGDQTWSADWPHTQISPPAVVRTDGNRAAFSLETELTAVVGHVTSGALEWLAIEPAPGASGIGVGLLPVIEPRRLGLFYLGLEIPNPEQPLRYYGFFCAP